ncbi:MAG: serine/threonine-protein phosphatase [Planctomycetes bacterium]|nr:serine/threonine-protein phosphatase [Planctomycetota bacterium]
MKIPAGFTLGVATHTGRVRTHNEDDYLIGALAEASPPLLFVAVADGMGGVAGGADASRLALRALASAVLDGEATAVPAERCRSGCAAAAQRIAEQAELAPILRGMGTTLTGVVVQGTAAQVVHVGDSRLYHWRRGVLTQVTTDHAVREPDNRLLRCVGGGSRTCVPDLHELVLRPGDRLLLCSDGVWSVLPPPQLEGALVANGAPQAAAEALVAAALGLGGPDNATAVVVDVGTAAAGTVACALPVGERPERRRDWPPALIRRAPWWPWALLVAALLLAAALLVHDGWRFGFGW